jgi:glutamyl-tRNA reductase
MTDQVVQVGVDLTTSTVGVLQSWRLTTADEAALVKCITQDRRVREAVLLSTCNRKEIYAVGPVPRDVASVLVDELSWVLGDDVRPVERYGLEAVKHLVSVAAGLESALLGEHEILNQVRRAHEAALAVGSSGRTTTHLFKHAITSGRKIRTALGIDGQRLSLTGLAADWLRANCAESQRRTAAVVGSGETAVQMMRHLRTLGFADLIVLNRSPDNVRRLADECRAKVEPLSALHSVAQRADVIICATAAPEPLIGRAADRIATVVDAGDGLYIIDLGVPRNVDPDVADAPGVQLLEMNSLVGMALAGEEDRAQMRTGVQSMLEAEAERFHHWQQTAALGPIIQHVQGRYETSIAHELQAHQPHAGLDADETQRLSRQISNKLLHPVIAGLKEIATQESPERARDIVEQLLLRKNARS